MISVKNSEKYEWGNSCFGWHLVQNQKLSVIQETMPAGSFEQMHRHHFAQQFFFILKGEATFLINGEVCFLKANEGIHVPPEAVHQIKNDSMDSLDFLVISEPPTKGDRENVQF